MDKDLETPAHGDLTASKDDGQPIGTVGPATDRDHAGRFTRGNKAALVVGARSSAFWMAHEAARHDIVRDVLADQGHSLDDAPRALLAVADGLAQGLLLRDSAFARLVESGGPTTSAGRTRRAFVVWQAASASVEKHARLIGIRRLPRPAMTIQDYLASRVQQAERDHGDATEDTGSQAPVTEDVDIDPTE